MDYLHSAGVRFEHNRELTCPALIIARENTQLRVVQRRVIGLATSSIPVFKEAATKEVDSAGKALVWPMNDEFFRHGHCITHALRTVDWCSARGLQARRRRRISPPTPPAFPEPPLPWPPPGRAIGKADRSCVPNRRKHTPSEDALCARIKCGLSSNRQLPTNIPISQTNISAENAGAKSTLAVAATAAEVAEFRA